jgi:hypothetical protein
MRCCYPFGTRADQRAERDARAIVALNRGLRYLEAMNDQQVLDRCEYTIKYQMQEIDRLRAEIERRDDELKQLLAWINGDADALTTLQLTYMDPKISTSDRIKAAGAAIAYERPKLSVQLRVGPAVLGERLDQGEVVKTIEHQP